MGDAGEKVWRRGRGEGGGEGFTSVNGKSLIAPSLAMYDRHSPRQATVCPPPPPPHPRTKNASQVGEQTSRWGSPDDEGRIRLLPRRMRYHIAPTASLFLESALRGRYRETEVGGNWNKAVIAGQLRPFRLADLICWF